MSESSNYILLDSHCATSKTTINLTLTIGDAQNRIPHFTLHAELDATGITCISECIEKLLMRNPDTIVTIETETPLITAKPI